MKLLVLLCLAVTVFGYNLDPKLSKPTSAEHVDLLIVLKGKADLSRADSLKGAEKGQYVLDTVQKVTREQQSNILMALKNEEEVTFIRPFYVTNAIAVRVASSGAEHLYQTLQKFDEIDRIVSDKVRRVQEPISSEEHPRLNRQNYEIGIGYINAPDLWARGIFGNGTIYANADTGIMFDHSTMVQNYVGTLQGGDHNYAWWDAAKVTLAPSPGQGRCGLNNPVPCDDNGHGTHTTSNVIGNQGVGVAPGSRWIGCRNMERGWGSPSSYLGCLEFFLAPHDLNGNNPNPNLRPHAVSNSYGCPPVEGCDSGTFTEAVLTLRQAGIFMAVSAGNDGSRCSTINSPPGTEPLVCSVAAANRGSDTIASFSSRGPARDSTGTLHRSPDITAPGVSVRAAWNNGGFNTISGTSMAAPHVAGAALLITQACPSLVFNVDAIEKLIYDTARPIFTTQGCGDDTATTTPNNVYGYGMLDVKAAVDACMRREKN